MVRYQGGGDQTMETTGLSLSWRKAMLSSFIILAATFLFMMYGDLQRGPPGDGYRSSTVDKLSNAYPVEGAIHAGGSAHPALEWFLDDDLFPLPDEEAATGIDTIIPKADTINEVCDTCCYRYVTISKGIVEMASEEELVKRGCQQRLPDALIFGVKKGGTTTLKNFISYHPDIAFTQRELKYFTSSTELRKGLQYYKSRMIYSTPGQVSMEKTPAYSHYPNVPALMSKTLPNVKLIMIMRDPVERAVSDFVHLQVTMAQACPEVNLHPVAKDSREPVSLSAACFNNSKYFISDTFEHSIIDLDGEIRFTNQLVSKGVYVKDIRRYLKYFDANQILALDGEAFINDPYTTVKKVEKFLGIRDYFTREHFYFDVQKGFFCLTKPIPNNCMNPSKGRPHPDISEETLDKLRKYYQPYNKALNELMNVAFHWSS